MKSVLNTLLVAFISILGLASCTSDKSPVTDSWALPYPQLVAQKPGETATLSVPFVASSLEVVSIAATLRFPGKGENPLKGVELSIQSECRTGNESASLETRFNGVDSIPLRSLVPEQYWRKLALPKNEVLVCNLTFDGINARGSTHRFEMVGVQIGHWEDLEVSASAALIVQSARLSESFPIMQLVQSNEGDEASTPNQEWQIELICSHFRNSRIVSSQRFGKALLTELAEGPLHSQSGQPSSSSSQDTRKTHLLQQCRVIAITHDKVSNVRFFRTTAPFQLQFPTINLETNFVTGFKIPMWLTFKSEWTFQLSIRNTSPNVIALVVPKRGPQRIWLQAIVMHSGQYFFQAAFQEEFDLHTTGGRLIANEGENEIVELGPNEVLHLEQRISKERSGTVCDLATYAWAYAKKDDPSIRPFTMGLGMRVAFDQDFVVRRLYNWDPTTRDTSSTSFEVFTLAWTKKPGDQILPGWLPQDSWVEHSGNGNMPSDVTSDTPRLGTCGTMRTIFEPKN